MNGKCDVPGCEQPTYMGWRPLSESRGWQICKTHWLRHKNQNDSFDLFEAFGLHRPRTFAAGRKRQITKPMQPEPEKRSDGSGGRQAPGRCRACGQAREPGHTYCEKCSRERRAEKNRERQKRHYDKVKNLTLLKHKNEGGMTGRNGAE